jgi:hypothetical protein
VFPLNDDPLAVSNCTAENKALNEKEIDPIATDESVLSLLTHISCNYTVQRNKYMQWMTEIKKLNSVVN